VRYNLPEHGWLQVTVGASGSSARLVVENTGPVIAPEDVDGLFEPFRRLATSERLTDPKHGAAGRGAGLGLSITRSVVQSHHGDVEAIAHGTGGLTVTVTIPLSR
jgi:signal transduction histidine kinase